MSTKCFARRSQDGFHVLLPGTVISIGDRSFANSVFEREVAVSYICHEGVAAARSESLAIRTMLSPGPLPTIGTPLTPYESPTIHSERSLNAAAFSVLQAATPVRIASIAVCR